MILGGHTQTTTDTLLLKGKSALQNSLVFLKPD
jgi:hypothetical protein